MQRFSKMGFAKRARTYSPYYLRDEMSQAGFTRVVVLCGYPLCRLTKIADPLPPVPASCRGDRRGMQLEVIGINDGPWGHARTHEKWISRTGPGTGPGTGPSWRFCCFRLLVVSQNRSWDRSQDRSWDRSWDQSWDRSWDWSQTSCRTGLTDPGTAGPRTRPGTGPGAGPLSGLKPVPDRVLLAGASNCCDATSNRSRHLSGLAPVFQDTGQGPRSQSLSAGTDGLVSRTSST